MRFLIDENLPRSMKESLEELGHDVALVWGSQLWGATDVEVAAFAVREDRVLVTRDLDFPLPGAQSLPGLVLLRAPNSWSGEQLTRLAADVIGAASNRIEGSIVVVSPGRVRWRSISDG